MSEPAGCFDHLPGGAAIETGLADIARGQETIEALLVWVGAPRLRAAGLDVPPDPGAGFP